MVEDHQPEIRVSLNMMAFNDRSIVAQLKHIENAGFRVCPVPIARISSPGQYLDVLREFVFWLPALYVLKRLSDKVLDKLGDAIGQSVVNMCSQIKKRFSSSKEKVEIEEAMQFVLSIHMEDGFRIDAKVSVDSKNSRVELPMLVEGLVALLKQREFASRFKAEHNDDHGTVIWDMTLRHWRSEVFSSTLPRKYYIFDHKQSSWIEHVAE
jgi:hypothetical protein